MNLPANPSIWFGTYGPRNAKIFILGEAWGSEEHRLQRPFVGESGRELDKMLAEAGIIRDECFTANIVNEKPLNNEMYRLFIATKEAKAQKLTPVNGLYPSTRVLDGLERVYQLIDLINPELIIACGNYPLWALSSVAKIKNSSKPSGWKVPAGIATVRGSQLVTNRGRSGRRLLPIMHPAAILRAWEDRSVTVHDLRVRVPLALNKSWSPPVKDYLAPPTLEQATNYLTNLARRLENEPTAISVDLETKRPTIACIGLAVSTSAAICIPFLKPAPSGYVPYWTFDEEVALVGLLRQVLNHPNALHIGQNYLYDIQYTSRWWRIIPRVHHDTMLAQHVIFPGTPKDLGYLASLYALDHYVYWKDDSKEWELKGDLSSHLRYNCDDCTHTLNIYHKQRDILTRMNLTEQFAFVLEEFDLAFHMMENGVPVDHKLRLDMTLKVMESSRIRTQWLDSVVQRWVRPVMTKKASHWTASPKQQMDLFYENLGLKTIFSRKTGNAAVDDEALRLLVLRYPEFTRIVDAIIELRSLGIFHHNFLSAQLDPDGRMRCSYNPGGTETFRFSSSENAFGRGTNLQNLPSGNEED